MNVPAGINASFIPVDLEMTFFAVTSGVGVLITGLVGRVGTVEVSCEEATLVENIRQPHPTTSDLIHHLGGKSHSGGLNDSDQKAQYFLEQIKWGGI